MFYNVKIVLQDLRDNTRLTKNFERLQGNIEDIFERILTEIKPNYKLDTIYIKLVG